MEREIHVGYDPLADAIYVTLRAVEPGGAPGTRTLDEFRSVDLDTAGQPVGVEFLCVSQGIDPSGVPAEREIREALRAMKGLRILAST